MNSHKDSERLRHQRQNKLLNNVMKIVPRPLVNGSTLKVRKLRHLVLYYYFMKTVHAQTTKGHSKIIKGINKISQGNKNSKKKAVKIACKPPLMHCGTKMKSSRANIVFLEADRSKSKEENFLDASVTKYNDNCPESSPVTNLEYKIPEVVIVNAINDRNAVFDHSPCLPVVENNMQVNSNNSNSPGECSMKSDLAPEDNYNDHKLNHLLIPTNFSIMNSSDQVREQSSGYDKARVLQNISNNENLIPNQDKKTKDFQNILQDYSSNSTLNDETIPVNENFYVANINFPIQDSNYILEACPVQNVSAYPINLPPGNVILATNHLNYRPFCGFDSTVSESQLYNLPPLHGNLSDLLENTSDNCSSSTLTDNLHIDLENFSDSSNESHKIIAGNSTELNASNDVCDTPKALVYDLTQSMLMNYDDCVLPLVSSNHYLENYNEQNEISFRPVGYMPYFDSVSPSNINFNEKPSIIHYSSFQDKLLNSRFVNDNVSFYSPSEFENLPSERLPLNPKLEIVTAEDSQEVFPVDSKPALFDEEVSYPLSQYINNY